MSIIIKNGQINLATGNGVINATQNTKAQYTEREKNMSIYFCHIVGLMTI